MDTLLGAIFVLVALNVINTIILIVAVVAMSLQLGQLNRVTAQLKNLAIINRRRNNKVDI